MDMRKFAGEQFIRVDDVRDGPISLQIAMVKEGKFDKPDMIFKTGEILSLNSTNTKILVRAYGRIAMPGSTRRSSSGSDKSNSRRSFRTRWLSNRYRRRLPLPRRRQPRRR